jgi:hypothetical protein
MGISIAKQIAEIAGEISAPNGGEGKPTQAGVGEQKPLTSEVDEELELEQEGEVGDDLPDPGPSGDDEDVVLEKFVDLADVIGVKPDDLYALKIALSDTGEEITIGQAKDRLQAIGKERSEIDRARAEVEREKISVVNYHQQLSSRAGQVNAAVEKAKMDILATDADDARIDWEALSKIDSGRAAFEKQKILQKRAEAIQNYERVVAQANQEQQQYMQQARNWHDMQLLEHVPEWRDRDTATRESTEIMAWLASKYMFSDNDAASMMDWRHRDIIRKAWLHDKGVKTVQDIKGKPPAALTKGIGKRPINSGTKKLDTVIKNAQQSRDPRAKRQAAMAVLDAAFARKR